MPINRDRILYEDDALLAVMKLSGELSVAGKGTMEKLSLFDFLRKEYTGIHPLSRLDYDTSGVIVFARSRKVLSDIMNTKFEHWTKKYHLLVKGPLARDTGTIRLPLPTRMTKELAPAETNYRVLERFPGVTYVEAELHAGRHHQIRRHFSMLKHPLVLDALYGDKSFNGKFSQAFHFHRFFLHAASVTFPHPTTGQILTIEAGLPIAFEKVLKKLRAMAKA